MNFLENYVVALITIGCAGETPGEAATNGSGAAGATATGGSAGETPIIGSGGGASETGGSGGQPSGGGAGGSGAAAGAFGSGGTSTGSGGSLGIPFGPYTLFDPTTKTPRPNTAVFTMAKDASTASNVLKFLTAIKTNGKRWLFTPTGGGHYLYMSDPNGNTCDKAESDQNLCQFDLDRWKVYMGAYNTATIKSAVEQAIADGTIIGASLIDEPYVHGVGGPGSNTWGEDPKTGKSPITKAIVDEMCAYAKSIFPDLPVGPVHQPAYFEPDISYQVCDMMIVEYSWATKLLNGTSNKGDVTAFRDEALWMAKRDGIRILFGLNILDGGIPSSVAGSCAYGGGPLNANCRMSPTQVREWGKTLGAAGCGLDMWRYDADFMANAENQKAFDDIRAYLADKPSQSCHKPGLAW